MKILKIIFTIGIGIGLLSGVILTKTSGLSDTDRACYETAVNLQKNADDIGFENFRLTDYPVAFSDGKKEYVLVSDGENYRLRKRLPVIETIAATAYEVDGHYEVIVPMKSMMKNFVGLMGESWTDENQVCAIWHEAFHCWQMENYEKNIENLLNGQTFDEEEFDESMINAQYSKNPKAKELFIRQMKILENSINEENMDKVKENMIQYKKSDEQRMTLLNEDVEALEQYYTVVEGTAQYIESYICRVQDYERYKEYYIDNISDYFEGAKKYYTLGMAQCMLLDRLDREWKSEYDFSKSLIELIYEKVGVS